MTVQIRKAERVKAPLKISISGPAGSGKSYSSLLMARGMASAWDKICVIDTENQSADLYSNLGDYNVITLEAPFTTAKYIEAIKAAEDAGMEVIIIDSVTHVWSGEGGVLEYQGQLGGRYQDWKKATPLYQKWLNTILESHCDVICTIRKKTHYEMTNDNGKLKVEKKGMEDIIRDGFDYEMTVALALNQNNMTDNELCKDRTKLFKGQPDLIITEVTGKMLKEWKDGGAINYARLKEQIFDELVRIGKQPNTKEEAEATIKEIAKLNLVEKNYEKILAKLKAIETPKADEPQEDLKATIEAKMAKAAV